MRMAILVACALATSAAVAETTDAMSPEDIIRDMRNAYSKATSYSGTGVVEILVSAGGQVQKLTKPFSITFKRPDLIRIEWTDSFAGIPTPYVLWNGTNGTFMYAPRMNQLGTKYDSLAQAIGGQSGSSGASVAHVPDLLLKVLKTPAFSDVSNLNYIGVEKLRGVDCHRVSGTRQGKPMDLWIGKTDFLLREIHTSTPFGKVTEIHEGIMVNGAVADAQVSFTPPQDAEHVDVFDVKKNMKQSNPVTVRPAARPLGGG